MDLTAEGRDENGVILINITGNDRGYLLSNSAALLNSLEYLLNRIFPGNRGKRIKEEDAPGIELDSDDYRKHRKLELELLAQMASQKVLASRKPLTLQPMAPLERKIVHLALSGIGGVASRSEGSGENRSITIYPCVMEDSKGNP
jgi:spoIIIJ-associated protein